MGDMEGDNTLGIRRAWPTRCATSVTNSTAYSGEQSLYMASEGKSSCFFFRPAGPSCGAARISNPLQAGDIIQISIKVRLSKPNQVFMIYTGHYSEEKNGKNWRTPEDDSHIISRTVIPQANEWYEVNVSSNIFACW